MRPMKLFVVFLSMMAIAGLAGYSTANPAEIAPLNLTNNPGRNDTNPTWSPNGTQMTFAVSFDERNSAIYLMRADGTHQRRLTADPGGETIEADPAWSPGGAQVAFVRNGDLYVMQADGTHLVQLTSERNRAPGGWVRGADGAFRIGRAGKDSSPTVSKNGQQSLDQVRRQALDLILMDLHAGRGIRLAPEQSSAPSEDSESRRPEGSPP